MNKFRIFEISVDDLPVSAQSIECSVRNYWIEVPKLGRCLLKEEYPACKNAWVEKITSEIAKLIGIPTATYELAQLSDGRRAILSPTYLSPNCHELSGQECLDKRFGDNLYPYSINNTFDTIDSLNLRLPNYLSLPDEIKSSSDLFAGYLLFDFLVNNMFRSVDNWGIQIDDISGQKQLLPNYSNSCGLGSMLSTSDSIPLDLASYLITCNSAFQITRHKDLLMADIPKVIIEFKPAIFDVWAEKITAIKPTIISELFQRIPEGWINELALSYAVELINFNQKQLRDIIKRKARDLEIKQLTEANQLAFSEINLLPQVKNISELATLKVIISDSLRFINYIIQYLIIDKNVYGLKNDIALERLELNKRIWLEIREYYGTNLDPPTSLIPSTLTLDSFVRTAASLYTESGESPFIFFEKRNDHLYSVTKLLLDTYGDAIDLNLYVVFEGNVVDLFIRLPDKRSFALAIRSYNNSCVKWNPDKQDFFVTSKRRKKADKSDSLTRAITQLKSILGLKKEKSPIFGVSKAERSAPITKVIVLAEGTEIDRNRNKPELWAKFGKADALKVYTDTFTYVVEEQHLVDFLLPPEKN